MSDVINLNKARKRKQRVEVEQLAVQNRIRFGRTQEQKQREILEAVEAQKRLDGLKRDE